MKGEAEGPGDTKRPLLLQAKPDLSTFSDEISRDTGLRNDNDRNPQRGPTLALREELKTW